MKTLYFVRHGKSSWKEMSLDDSERPLNKRGKRDAPFMGKLLFKLGVNPELIISSPAKRAYSTAKIIANEIGYSKKNIEVNESVYGASDTELYGVIGSLDDSLEIVMIFGHNPELTSFVNRIIDSSILNSTSIDNLPTCAVVGIEFDIDNWKEIIETKGRLILYEYPKKYME